MAENVKIKKRTITPCPLEKYYLEVAGYVTIHDGENNSQDKMLQGVKQNFFTRTLRKMVNGKFIDMWVIIRYDLRSGYLVGIKEVKMMSDGRKREQKFKMEGRGEAIEAGGQ